MGVLVLISSKEENDLHSRIFFHLDCPGFTEQRTNIKLSDICSDPHLTGLLPWPQSSRGRRTRRWGGWWRCCPGSVPAWPPLGLFSPQAAPTLRGSVLHLGWRTSQWSHWGPGADTSGRAELLTYDPRNLIFCSTCTARSITNITRTKNRNTR